MLNLTFPVQPTIILVCSQAESCSWFSALAREQGYQLELCHDAIALLPLLNRLKASLILLDITRTDRPLDICEQIRNDPPWQELPIIALNPTGIPLDKEALFAAGINDYLLAPFHGAEVRAKCQQLIQYYHLQQERNILRRSVTQQYYIIEQMEASWGLSEERFHKVFGSSPSLLFLIGYDRGQILEVNQNFVDQTGYDREEVIGSSVSQLNLLFSSESWGHIIDLLERDKEIVDIEILFKNKSDRCRIGLLSAQAIDLAGQQYFLFNISDITGLKQSEEFLQNSEAELLTLFAAMDDAIVVLDYHGKYLKIAPTRYSQFQGNPDRQIERYLHEVLPEEAADFQLYWTQKVIDEQRTIENLEYRLAMGNRETWFMATVSPLQTNAAVWVSRDITSRKQAEEKVKLFERAIASSTNGIIITDATQPENPVIYVNSGFEKLTGYTQEEMFGKSCSSLQGNYRNQPGLKLLRNAIKSGTACRVILRNYRKDNSIFWNDLSLSPVFNDRGKLTYYIGIQTDITELKIAQNALKKQFDRALLIERVTDELRQTLDSQQIFQTAANLIGETFQANRCLIHTYTPSLANPLPLVAEYTALEKSSMRFWDMPVDNNPYLSIILAQEDGIAIDNININPLVKKIRPLLINLGIKSILGIRTSYQNQPNGAIFLQQCDWFRQWDKDEVDFLESVASQLGIAINQAQLLDREKERRKELDLQNIRLQQEIGNKNRMELALRESESNYRELVHNANSMIVRIDCQGKIVFFNEFAQEFFGYSEHEIIGEDFQETIVSILDSEEMLLQPSIFDILKCPEQYPNHESKHQLRNGDRVWIQWTNRALLDERGKLVGLLSVGIDTTERKQAQIELQKAKHSAELANLTKSQFIARMSHELRTPLNAILGFTQMLLQRPRLDREQNDYLNIINRSGEHLLNLINDILSLSKIEAGKISINLSCLSLHTLIYEVQDMLRLKAEQKGLNIDIHIDEFTPEWVIADEGKIRQILMNLLSNSVKFTTGGKIELRVRAIPEEDSSNRQRFYWEIEDTGEGIESQELPLLFEPFIQTESGRKSGQGTGLGLTICKQLIQIMSGNIQVLSELERGTLVKFNLPLQLASSTEIPQINEQKRAIALAPNQPSYRILVVDDSWENRHLLVQQLEPLGFTVCEAENGEQAIALWSSWSPDFIWMDLQMPVMNGYQATRHIRDRERQEQRPCPIPIVALTASVLDENRTSIQDVGCNELVYKPVTQDTLLQKMADYLGIEYLYESVREEITINEFSDSPNLDLTLEDLVMMPIDWIIQLNQATTQADEESIVDLVATLPPAQAPLGDAISSLVARYHFEQLLEATAEAIDHLRQLED